MGVALAYVLVRMVFDAGQVITLVGLALFLAVGLDPAVVWLTDRRVPRWAAVIIVVTALLGFVAAFAVAAVGPITTDPAAERERAPLRARRQDRRAGSAAWRPG